MPSSDCLAKFDVERHLLAQPFTPLTPPSKAFLTTCPVNGFSNQLIALFAAAALARDLGGLPFWIPPLVLDNLDDLRPGVPDAERANFCASCYEHVARARTIHADEVMNVSRIEAVGGVRFPANALGARSFHRSRTVLDVCNAQRHTLAFGDARCEPPDRVGAASTGALARSAVQGAAAYACVRDAVKRSLLNTSSTAAPLWVRFGPSVQPYYSLCARPPLHLPAFFEPSAAVVAVSDSVWPRMLRRRASIAHYRDQRLPTPTPPGSTPRACAHIRLSLPGELDGWDKLGSPFTETIPAQVTSLRVWLGPLLSKHVPVLVLSDAPWLLQRLIPELDGCIADGGCIFAEAVLDDLVEQHARSTGASASAHFRSATAQLACSAASHLLLTPKSSFSKMIRMLALRRAQPIRFAYTRARVRFAALAADLSLLSSVRRCSRTEGHVWDDEARKVCIVAAVEQALSLIHI